MLLHVDHQPVNVAKIANMAQLVHLIVADRLDLKLGSDVLEVVGGRRQRRDPASGESDLGSGGELVDQVRIACSFALHKDLDQMVLLVLVQVMYAVRVVPEDPEVGSRRLKSRKSPDCLVRIGITRGIAVFWHTPDALDGIVLVDQLLDHIHVRSFRAKRDRNHLDAKIFRDREMSVISGNGAKEFHSVLLAPGSISHDSVRHGSRDCVVHDVEGRVSENDNVVRIVLHHIAQKHLGFLHACQYAVVTAVRSVFTRKVTLRREDIHHSHGKIELIHARLASAHIEVQIHLLIALIVLLKSLELSREFVSGHFRIWFHIIFLLFPVFLCQYLYL